MGTFQHAYTDTPVHAHSPAFPKVVLFDLSGTLIDTLQGVDRPILDAICREYLGIDYLSAKSLYPKDETKSLCTYFDVLFGDQADEAYRAYIDQFIKAIPDSVTFHQTRDSILAMRMLGIKCGVISNRPHEYTHAALEYHILDQLFDVVMCAEHPGLEKPDPNIIHFALDHLGISSYDPHEIWMVGDSIVDVICADDAGVQPVLFSDKHRGDEYIVTRITPGVDTPETLPLQFTRSYPELLRTVRGLLMNRPDRAFSHTPEQPGRMLHIVT